LVKIHQNNAALFKKQRKLTKINNFESTKLVAGLFNELNGCLSMKQVINVVEIHPLATKKNVKSQF